MGLASSVAYARRLGVAKSRRSPSERAVLRRAIAVVDRLMPGGANCYRRVLLEIALDAGAAKQPVMLGLRNGGGPRTGHAWLDGVEPSASSYDAVFSA
jgi:hypothetical protein